MSREPETPGSYRWAVLLVCVLGTVQTYIHRVGFAPLIPLFVADLGLTYAAAGTVMTAYFWTYLAVQVPVGLATDRLGPRRVMLASLAVLVLGAATFPLSEGYGTALLTRCVVGLGAAGIWLPSLRLIQEWFPAAERGRATGLCGAGAGVGGTAALALVPVLSAWLGWRWGYGTTVLPVLVTLALTALVVRPGPLGAPTAGAAGPAAPLGRVLRDRDIWPLCLTALFGYGAFVGVVTWLPTFLVAREGLTPAAAGLVTGLVTAGTAVSWPLAGFLSDRMGRRKSVCVASLGLSALVCGALALLVPGSGAAGAAAAALGLGIAAGGTVLPFVMLVDLYPPSLVGTASGVVNTFWLAGGAAVPPLIGRLLDAGGDFSAAFVACGASAVLAAASGAFAREPGGERGAPGQPPQASRRQAAM